MGEGAVLVVIAHPAGRPVAPLVALLDDLAAVPAGAPHAARVVVNRGGGLLLRLPDRHWRVWVHDRPDVGGHLAAWDAGWRAGPQYEGYLFVRSGYQVVKPGWAGAFARAAAGPGVGLVTDGPAADGDAPADRRGRLGWAHQPRERRSAPRPGPWRRDGRPWARRLFSPSKVGRPFRFVRRSTVSAARDSCCGPNAPLRPPTGGPPPESAPVLFATHEMLVRIGGFPGGAVVSAAADLSAAMQVAGLRLAAVGPRPFTFFAPEW